MGSFYFILFYFICCCCFSRRRSANQEALCLIAALPGWESLCVTCKTTISCVSRSNGFTLVFLLVDNEAFSLPSSSHPGRLRSVGGYQRGDLMVWTKPLNSFWFCFVFYSGGKKQLAVILRLLSQVATTSDGSLTSHTAAPQRSLQPG